MGDWRCSGIGRTPSLGEGSTDPSVLDGEGLNMAAAAIPLLMSKAQGTSAAVKNDIAVVKWTTQPKKKKGKKARQTPPKDVELHINGSSIGMGLAALGAAGLIGAAALWASGMGLAVHQGKEKIIKARTVVKPTKGDWSKPSVRTYVYSGNNRPIRSFSGGISRPEDVLSRQELTGGWKMARQSRTIIENTDSAETIYYAYVFRNDDKRSIKMGNRPRFLSSGNGGISWQDYLKMVSPISNVLL
jgi:hypothetical protein